MKNDILPAMKQTGETLQKFNELIDPTGGVAATAMGAATGTRDSKDVVFAAAGAVTEVAGVKGLTKHALNQAIGRAVKPGAILDALKNPIQTGKVIYDKLGRPSQRIIGKKAEVVINPDTKVVVSVNPLSTKKAKRLARASEENQ
jgi:hypothetical protein